MQPNQTQINQQAGSSLIPNDPSQLDPTAVTLAKAIRQQESGSATPSLKQYNAIGDNGSSHGAYQFNGDNFQEWAKQYGLNPTDTTPQNQDKVAYGRIKDLMNQGNSLSEIAARWNGAKIQNGKYIPLNPQYVSNIQKNYTQLSSQYAQGNNQSPSGVSNLPSATQSQSQASGQAKNPSIQNSQTSAPTQSEGILQKAGDVAKGIGNFLFPIVGDVYHDIRGDNTKTALQQVGDTALSALPFIPGLGEVGEAAKGAEASVEGGEAVVGSTKGGGVLSKLLASPVAKGAATGYGAGVASNLSQGQGLGQAFTPNFNNIGGAVLGGAAPAIIKGASGVLNSLTGIDPAVSNELSKLGSQANPEDLSLMQKYNQAAQSHASDVRTPSVENIAADNLDAAADKISQNTSEAGKAVGAAKMAVAQTPLQDASTVAQDFANEVKQRYGLNLQSDPNGKLVITSIEGRMRQVDPADISKIKSIAQQLNILGKGSTVGQATDVLSNISDALAASPKDIYGKSVSPVDQLFTKTSSDLNDVVRKSSPELATANDRYSGLKSLQEEVRQTAGNKLQRGELLMKRIFSNKSVDSLDLFDKIKAETGIDLTKHAVLAKNAIDNYGSKADKSLLQQALEGASEGKGGAFSSVISLGKNIARKTIANPGKQAERLLKGKQGIIQKFAPYLTKGAIELGSHSGQ